MDGQITNGTDESILVYGPKRAGETQDNSLYLLPPGQTTPAGWDADGFFVPDNRKVSQAVGATKQGPLAVKYRDYRSATITKSAPDTFDAPFNEGLFRPGDINWPIPGIPSHRIGTYPTVPDIKNPEEEKEEREPAKDEKSERRGCTVVAVTVIVIAIVILIIVWVVT
jgi:hypothetical protein